MVVAEHAPLDLDVLAELVAIALVAAAVVVAELAAVAKRWSPIAAAVAVTSPIAAVGAALVAELEPHQLGTGATGPARGWRWQCHPWGSRVPLLGQRAAS